jgi:hypothetical protein
MESQNRISSRESFEALPNVQRDPSPDYSWVAHHDLAIITLAVRTLRDGGRVVLMVQTPFGMCRHFRWNQTWIGCLSLASLANNCIWQVALQKGITKATNLFTGYSKDHRAHLPHSVRQVSRSKSRSLDTNYNNPSMSPLLTRSVSHGY